MPGGGSIYLPGFFVSISSGAFGVAANPLNLDSGLITIPNYSDVHLGYVRSLKNIVYSTYLLAQYSVAVAAASDLVVAPTCVCTFQLILNRTPVFSDSSVVSLASLDTSTSVTDTTNAAAIFADFVNPIIVRNGDLLQIRVTMTGVPVALWAESDSSGDSVLTMASVLEMAGNFDASGHQTQNGVIYYSEFPDV